VAASHVQERWCFWAVFGGFSESLSSNLILTCWVCPRSSIRSSLFFSAALKFFWTCVALKLVDDDDDDDDDEF